MSRMYRAGIERVYGECASETPAVREAAGCKAVAIRQLSSCCVRSCSRRRGSAAVFLFTSSVQCNIKLIKANLAALQAAIPLQIRSLRASSVPRNCALAID